MQLGDNYLDFKLNYLTRFGLWSLDVYRDDSLLIAGATLEPNTDLTANTGAGIGRLYCVGVKPTFDNLGDVLQLVWSDV